MTRREKLGWGIGSLVALILFMVLQFQVEKSADWVHGYPNRLVMRSVMLLMEVALLLAVRLLWARATRMEHPAKRVAWRVCALAGLVLAAFWGLALLMSFQF
jgi:hypothetical protein